MDAGLNLYGKTDKGEAVNIIPQMRISSMDILTQGFNFVVSLNEFTFGFQSVSGLSVNKKVNYISEGGVNDHQIMVGAPSDDSPALTFKRGILLRTSTVADRAARAAAAKIPNNMARKGALLEASMADPQESLETGPALGIIQVYSRRRNLRALFSFLSLGMLSWKIDDLDALSNSVLCEEITIAHTGLVRHPVTIVPQVVSAGSNFVSDIKTLNNADLTYNKVKEAEERKKQAEELKKKKQEELELIRKQKKEQEDLKKEEENLKELKRQLEIENSSET